eukprot:31177-Pelagococcus_subviridis.AAC.10
MPRASARRRARAGPTRTGACSAEASVHQPIVVFSVDDARRRADAIPAARARVDPRAGGSPRGFASLPGSRSVAIVVVVVVVVVAIVVSRGGEAIQQHPPRETSRRVKRTRRPRPLSSSPRRSIRSPSDAPSTPTPSRDAGFSTRRTSAAPRPPRAAAATRAGSPRRAPRRATTSPRIRSSRSLRCRRR